MSIEASREEENKTSASITLCEEFWSEFILVAQFLHRRNNDAEIADVFEWLRQEDLGGSEYSLTLLERVDREVATDCAREMRNE